MLYITFDIKDVLKFQDFETLYKHLVNVRQPGYQFPDNSPEIDWDSKQTQDEVDIAVKKLNDYLDIAPEVHRRQAFIPDYATTHLEKYIKADNYKLEALGLQNVDAIFNYLEHGFEVDMDHLEKIDRNIGIIRFSTGNYPFGGIERFIITLKAFGLTPTECFDGFAISKIEWISDTEYKTTELQEKTKVYLQPTHSKNSAPLMELLSHFLASEKSLYLAAGIIGIVSAVLGLLFILFSNHKSFAITLIFIGLIEVAAMFPAYLKYQQKFDDKVSVYEADPIAFAQSEIVTSEKALKSFFSLKLIYGGLIVILILAMSFISPESMLFGIFTALILHLAFAITIDNFGEKYTKTYLNGLQTVEFE